MQLIAILLITVSILTLLSGFITILSIYYVILRYHMLNLSSIWLRIFSYIVAITSLAIVYIVIFAIIFAALFRGSTPSIEVIALNFIMTLIFLCLVPAINRLFSFFNNLINQKKIGLSNYNG